MTRETKMGLLIGLGFIVVFAILLSHTGPATPAGDKLAMAPRGPAGKQSPLSTTSTQSTYVPADQSRSTARPAGGASAVPATLPSNGRIGLGEPQSLPRSPRDIELDSDRISAGLPLPQPRGLARNRVDGQAAVVADAGKQMTPWERLLAGPKALESEGNLSSTHSASSNPPVDRVAPSLKEREATMTVASAREASPVKIEPPQPAVRPTVLPGASLTTATPGPSVPVAPPVKTELASAEAKAPPVRQEAPKEYVIQKGDTLRKIVKDSYGVSSTKAVEFLVASNKSKIKDKHMIVEGQTLVIPPLPPEMFEGTVSGNIDVTGTGEGIRTVTSEELSKVLAGSAAQQRTAPPANKKDLAARPSTLPSDVTLNVLVKQDRGLVIPESNGAVLKTAGAVQNLDKFERAAAVSDKPVKSEKSGYRMYEVKSGDTPRSISARELGSVKHWEEIMKLNPALDAKKLRPGTKIKIPDKKPLASVGPTRWATA